MLIPAFPLFPEAGIAIPAYELGTLGITFTVAVIGESFSEKLINGKFDISYGLYIYGFPIQQIVINAVTHRFWLGMAISALLAVAAGYLSYRFVEKPFLRRSHKAQSPYDIAIVDPSDPVPATR